jgi:hypothetical protein
LGLFDPAGYEDRIGSRFERRAVLLQLGVAVGDLLPCGLVRLRLVWLGGVQIAHGLRERVRAEQAG